MRANIRKIKNRNIIFIFFLSMTMVFLQGCNSDNDNALPEPPVVPEPEPTPDPDPDPDPMPDPDPIPVGEQAVLPASGGQIALVVDDLNLNITVPAGAVTEDTMIGVSTADPESFLSDSSAALLALNFQPSGLQFAAPIQVTTDFQIPENQMVVGLLESDGEIEPLTYNVSQLPVNSEEFTTTFDLPHFSNALISGSGYFTELLAPSSLIVGATGEIEVKITRGDTGDTVVSTEFDNVIASGPIVVTNSDSTFSPGISSLARFESANLNLQFTCTDEGSFDLFFSGSYQIEPTADLTIFGRGVYTGSMISNTVSGNCEVIGPVDNGALENIVGHMFNEARLSRVFNLPETFNVATFTPAAAEPDTTANDQIAGVMVEDGLGTSLVKMPNHARDCLRPVPNTTLLTTPSPTNFSALFDCTRSADGSNNPESLDGQMEIRNADGSPGIDVIVGESGTTTNLLDAETIRNIIEQRTQSPQITFVFGDTEVTDTLNSFHNLDPVQPFQLYDEGARPNMEIVEPNGLQSQLKFQPNVFDQVGVFLTTADQVDGQYTGILDVQTVPSAPDSNEPITLPLIRGELLEYITQQNIVIDQVVVSASKNQTVAAELIFAEEPPLPDGEFSAADPKVGLGQTINTSVSSLTPGSVCPLIAPTLSNTRCSGGNREAILSVNGADEVAIFNSITGEHAGFFLQDVDFSTAEISRPAGFKAAQAPDQCVLYSDAGGQMLLFDSEGNQLFGDGLGGLSTASETALLNGRSQDVPVLEYRGFDFYSANGVDDWKLFVAQRSDTDGDASGFIDTTQIVRYDYSVTSNTVLSNPALIASINSSNDTFQDIKVIGDKLYVSHELSGEEDTIRIFEAQTGDELPPFATDFFAPRQIEETLDGNIVAVDFPRERFRIMNIDTGETIREYILGNEDNRGNDRLRGVMPLRNGDFLASGLSDINRAIVNQHSGFQQVFGDNRSSTGVLLGKACLP